ncbi:alpha/beta hydrolase family esterase [Streptomyces sp. NPDC086787]|uniref:extracellular catalytic domain type 1 short-chain-length polyhydroxyalkanoate depolymerase n=1 Tax=Streptomyces sp. NPDC086787 TaxID=3365759 RepID=UPI00382E98A3
MSSLLSVRRVRMPVVLCALLSLWFAMSASGPTAFAAPLPGRDHTGYLISGGLPRSYAVHLPPGHATAAGLPVVLALHGRWQTGTGMRELTHLDKVADREGFAVVYPVSVFLGWSDSRGATWAAKLGVDDVGFIRDLIDRLTGTDHADAARVYAAGFSNGAVMTELLGCELADRLSGIAVVAGTMPEAMAPVCHPRRPLPVMIINGTQDPLVPYDGGASRADSSETPLLSVADTAAKWRTVDGCTGETVRSLPPVPGDRTATGVAAAVSCHGGTQVEVYTVTDGGHTWPGGKQYLPAALVGLTTTQFDASEALWGFFRSHAAG